MVAIFTGMGAGAERGSGKVLGGGGLLGSASLGRSAEQVLLNAATGNLMIQQQDEMLVGLGPDATIARTYNSLGNLTDENGDNWRQSTDRRVYGLVGGQNALNSTVKRVSADGSEITYTWDNGKAAYVATDGSGAYDQLVWNGSNAWTWTDGDSQLTETYAQVSGSQWLLSQQTDTTGKSVAFSYLTGTSHVDKVTVTDGSGNVQYLQYAWSGNNITLITTSYKDLVSNTAKTLTRTRYTYDTNGRLSVVTVDLSPENNSITDGKVYTTTYAYKAVSGADMHLVSSITESDGSKLTIGYDGSQRVTSLVQSVTGSVTRTTTIGYVSATRTTITDATGQVTTLDYDANGNLTTITGPQATAGLAPQVTKFTYNGTGDVTSVTDPLGNTTSYSGFVNGKATTIADPINTTTRTFGSKNELLTQTVTGIDQSGNPTNLTTRYIYDTSDRLAFEISPDGNVVEHRYDATSGLETYTLTYRGATASLSIWDFDHMTGWVNGLTGTAPSAVNQTHTLYDARGNVTSILSYAASTSPGNPSTANGSSQTDYVYDQAGQLLSRTDTGRTPETFVYDGMGRVVASNNIQGGRTSILFDDANSRTIVTLANGLTETSTYNLAGELISSTQYATPTNSTNLKPDLTNVSQWSPAGLSLPTGTGPYTFTGTGSGGTLWAGNFTMAAGDMLSFEVTLRAAGSPATLTDAVGINASGGLGWGDGSDVTATILSGPGSISTQNSTIGPGVISGLRTDADTRIRITRTFSTATTASVFFYLKGLSGATTSDAVTLSAPNIIKTTAAEQQAAAVTASYKYDQLGRLRMVTDATQHNSYMIYDNAGRKVGDINHDGQLTEYKYDADNRIVATVRYQNSMASRLALLSDPNQSFDLNGTDAGGAAYQPAASSSDLWTFNVYDKNGRTIETIDGAGDATGYSYDGAGRLTSTTAYGNKLSATQIANLKAGVAVTNLKPDLSNTGQWQVGTLHMDGNAPGPYQFTATTTGGNLWAGNFAVAAGDTLTWEITVRGAGATTTDALGFNATGTGWGDGTGITATILSGRGTITVNNSSPITLTGLQTDADTRIRITRTFTTATNAAAFFYVKGVGGAAIGDSVILSSTSITKTPSTALTLPTADATIDKTSRIIYDKSGRVVATVDGEGYLSTTTYDAGGVKIAETSYAKPVAAAHQASGSLTTLLADVGTSAQDRITHYVYDNEGLLTFVVDAQNHVTEYFYSTGSDVIGKPTQTVQYAAPIGAPGAWTVAGVRAAINAVTGLASNASNRISQAFYDADENLIYSVDAAGGFTAFTYDVMGHVTKTVRYASTWDGSGTAAGFVNGHAADTDNRVTRNFYDGRGDLVYAVDGENYVTRFDYDAEHRQIGTVRWDVPVSGIGDATLVGGLPALITTAMAGVSPTPAIITTAISYDTEGRVSTTTDAENAVTTITYNANGTIDTISVKRASDPSSEVVTKFALYDGAGRVLTRIDAYGATEQATTKFTYDAFGQVTSVTDPLNNVTYNYYDQLGHVVAALDAENHAVETNYNAFGEVTSVIRRAKPGSGTVTAYTPPAPDTLRDEVTKYYYDTLGRVVRQVDAEGYETDTGYTALGDIASVTRYATNLWPASLPSAGHVNSTITAVAPPNDTINGAPAYSLAVSAGGAPGFMASAGAAVTNGQSVTFSFWIKKGTVDFAAFGIRGATSPIWGDGTDSATIASGSGTISQYNGLWSISGLDPNQATLVVVTRTFHADDNASIYFYAGTNTATAVTGDSVIVGDLQAAVATSSFTYDKLGRVTQTLDPLGNYTKYSYTAFGEVKDRKAALAGSTEIVTSDVYDHRGLLKSETVNTTSRSALYSYNVFGKVKSVTDGTFVTNYQYDGDGRLKKTTDALSNSTSYQYDVRGNLVAITDPLGKVTRSVYDRLNRKVATIDATGAITTMAYDVAGNLVTTTSYANKVPGTFPTALEVTPSMLSLAMPTPNPGADQITHYAYDKNGVLRFTVDASGHVVEQVTDAFGNVVQTIAYDGTIAPSTYSTTSIAAAITPAMVGDQDTRRAEVAYDRDNRLIFTVDALGHVQETARDAVGDIVHTIAYDGTITTTDYTLSTIRSLVASLASAPGTRIARSVYDRDNRLAYAIDALGQVTHYVYDRAGNVISTTELFTAYTATGDPDFGTMETWAGSHTNALDRKTRNYYDLTGTLRYTVDALGYVSKIDYDSSGRVTVRTSYADQNLAALDDASATATLDTTYGTTPASARVTSYSYDTAGRLTGTTTWIDGPSGANTVAITHTLELDAAGRVLSSTEASNTDDASKTSYLYDDVGRVVRKISADNTADASTEYYYYDALGRKVATVDGDGYLCIWGYDNVDNLTSESRYGNPISAAVGMSLATLQGLAGTATDDATTTTYYDAFGDAIRTVDARGNEALAFYDNLGRVTRQIDAERYITDTTYTRSGQVETVTRRQAGTNTWSADGASWAATSAISTATGSAIDGSNSYTLKPQTSGTPGYVQSANASLTAGQTVTFSFWIKKGSLTSASFGINAATGGWGGALDTTASIVSGSGTLTQTSGGLWSISGLDNGGAATLVVVTRKFSATDTATARIYAGSSTSSAQATDSVIVADPLFTRSDAVTSFTYDNDDRLTSTTDAEGYTESYKLDAFGQRIEVRNKLNGTVVDGVTLDTTAYYEFDNRGLLTKETLPVATQSTANIVNKYEYDANGNRTKMVEAYGATEQRTTNYTYDKLGRLTRTEHDQVDTITLTDSGLVTATGVTPVELVNYDARGNVIENDQASKIGSTTTVYARTLYWYDDLNRVTTMLVQTDATSGVLTTYGYDKNGNRTRETTYATAVALPANPGGTAPAATGTYRQTTHTYDRANRLKSTTVSSLVIWSGAGSAPTTTDVTTSLTYDRDGNVTIQTDGRLNSTYTWYDRLGRAIAQVDAENYMTVWTRDAEGNVLSETRHGRKLDAFTPGATPPVPMATGLDRTTVFTYDKNGRRLTETRLSVASRTVAADGTLSLETIADAKVTYTYNGLGEVLSKVEANNDTTQYKYDKIGRLILETDQAFTDFNGQTVNPRTAYTYDGLNDLLTSRVQFDATGTSANDRVTTYVYGAGGRLSSVTDAENNTHYYSYDVAGRQVLDRYTRKLSSGANAETEAQVSRFDVSGHVITQTTARLNGTSWVFTDTAGTAYDAVRMRYDAFGEMTGRGITAGPAATAIYQEVFDYDSGGRLWHSNSGGGVDHFYLYDQAGNQTLVLSSTGADMSGYAAGTYNYTNLISSSGTIIAANGVTNLNATTTITIYDKRGQALFVRSPDRQLTAGSTVTTITTGKTYNAFGEVASETEARGFDASGNSVAGFTTTYVYNTLGKLVTKYMPAVNVTRADGGTATINPTENYFYDISGRLVGVENADSLDAYSTTGARYYTTRQLLAGSGHGDADALVVQQFDPEGGKTKTGYDVFGDARSSSVLVSNDAGVAVWRTTLSDYDKMGRLITVTHPTVAAGTLGNNVPNQTHYDEQLVDHYTYDLLGERLAHTQTWSENGVAKSRLERTDYDYKGRVVSTIGYANDAMTYTYSAFDASQVTTGLGTFGGWLKTTTNGTAGRSEWEIGDYFGRTIDSQDYDKAGDGITPYNYDYTFNKAGQLVARGNNASVNNGGSVYLVNENITFTYLNTGLAAGQDGTAGTAVYSYDVAGNRVSENFGKGGVNYRTATAQFDALGRMTQWDEGSFGVGGTGTITTNPIETKWEYDASGNVRVARTSYRPINANGGFDPIVTPAREEWYLYDKTGRVTLSQGVFTGTAGSGSIARGDTGIAIGYYLDGNRRSTLTTQTLAWTGWVSVKGSPTYYDEDPQDGTIIRPAHDTYRGDQQETYTYAADGSLAKVSTSSQGYVLSGAEVFANFDHSMTGVGSVVTIDRDTLGRISHYLESSSKGTYERNGVTYDAADREQSETTVTIHGGVVDTTAISDYYLDGLLSYQTRHNYTAAINASNPTDSTADNAAPDTRQDYTYTWWDGALQSSLTYNDGNGHVWTTNYLYDGSGHISQAQISDGQPRNANYVTDQNGMIINRSEERTNGSTTNMPREVHYLYGGIQLGQVGNNGTDNVPYAASIATRLATLTGNPGMFANGATKPTPFADFDQNYSAINGSSVAGTASTYTVQGSDTLASIAQTLWGDASLWYLIADANGKSASEALTAGEVLTIPAKVVNRANTSDTFKPYDPNEALGDTSPTRAPTPPKANSCGVFGAILLVVIAVAVVAILHVPIANLLESVAGSVFGTGGALGVAGTAIASGALAGAAGSIVSQGFGVATGLQQGGFSWKGVALAGISGAIGGGLQSIGGVAAHGAEAASQSAGSAAANVADQVVQGAASAAIPGAGVGAVGSGLGAMLGSAARAVAGSVLSQGIGTLLHLQSHFDWVGVAAAGVGAIASSGVASQIHGNSGVIVGGVAGGIANASTRSLITGTDFGDNIRAALPDIIGNTVGNLIGNAVARRLASGANRGTGLAEDAASAATGQTATSSGAVEAPTAGGIDNLTQLLAGLGKRSLAWPIGGATPLSNSGASFYYGPSGTDSPQLLGPYVNTTGIVISDRTGVVKTTTGQYWHAIADGPTSIAFSQAKIIGTENVVTKATLLDGTIVQYGGGNQTLAPGTRILVTDSPDEPAEFFNILHPEFAAALASPAGDHHSIPFLPYQPGWFAGDAWARRDNIATQDSGWLGIPFKPDYRVQPWASYNSFRSSYADGWISRSALRQISGPNISVINPVGPNVAPIDWNYDASTLKGTIGLHEAIAKKQFYDAVYNSDGNGGAYTWNPATYIRRLFWSSVARGTYPVTGAYDWSMRQIFGDDRALEPIVKNRIAENNAQNPYIWMPNHVVTSTEKINLATESIEMAVLSRIPLGRTVIAEGDALALYRTVAAEDIAAAHPLAGLAPSDVVDMAAARGLQTPRDSLILWSGLGRDGAVRAQAFAQEFGGTTLEMTPGGKWLDSMDLYGASSPFTSAEADTIWGQVSGRMVGQASGQVRSVLGQVRPMSVYNRYELPALRENSQILGLDPLQVRPMIKASGY